jgi:hypothetical protein
MADKIQPSSEPVVIKKPQLAPKDVWRAERQAALEVQKQKDKEMVKGIFRFHEVPGGGMSFVYGPIYKGDESQVYEMTDGEIYTVPLGVARHLNKNVWYPVYEHIAGEKDVQTAHNQMTRAGMRICKRVRRCSFQSLEYVDIEDLTPVGNPVVYVESI